MEKANTIVVKATAMKHAFEDLKVQYAERESEVISVSCCDEIDSGIEGSA